MWGSVCESGEVLICHLFVSAFTSHGTSLSPHKASSRKYCRVKYKNERLVSQTKQAKWSERTQLVRQSFEAFPPCCLRCVALLASEAKLCGAGPQLAPQPPYPLVSTYLPSSGSFGCAPSVASARPDPH